MVGVCISICKTKISKHNPKYQLLFLLLCLIDLLSDAFAFSGFVWLLNGALQVSTYIRGSLVPQKDWVRNHFVDEHFELLQSLRANHMQYTVVIPLEEHRCISTIFTSHFLGTILLQGESTNVTPTCTIHSDNIPFTINLGGLIAHRIQAKHMRVGVGWIQGKHTRVGVGSIHVCFDSKPMALCWYIYGLERS